MNNDTETIFVDMHCYPLENLCSCSHFGWEARKLAKTHENQRDGTSFYASTKSMYMY